MVYKMKRNRNKRRSTTPKFNVKTLALVVSIGFTGASSAALLSDQSWMSPIAITASLQTAFKAILEQATKVVDAFDTQMRSMDIAIAGAMKFETEQVSSAMRVFVKQMSVSSNMLAENSVKLAQGEVAVEQARIQKDRILETNEKLGSRGQAHKVCTVLSERQVIAKTVSNNNKSVPVLVSSTVHATPGAFGNPHKTQMEMNADHANYYCTPEQASAGYCSSASPQAGWDVQMSTLFTPTVTGSNVFEAQNALINNMIGLPDAPLPNSFKGSPTASNYLALKQRKDAIISPAINSLKTIQAEFAGMGDPHSAAKISPIKAIDDQVKRYLGSGDEYKSWNQSLVAATEEGVMKELLQVMALDLYLQVRQYKQYEREEVLLAGIVASKQHHIDKNNGLDTGAFSNSSDREKARLEARTALANFYDRSGN